MKMIDVNNMVKENFKQPYNRYAIILTISI